MILLGIETSTAVCSVALSEKDQLLASSDLFIPRKHAERLAPTIAFVLQQAGLEPTAIQAIAVSAGPGSYTGLRIGVSTAKGLAFATGATLIGVPTLEAFAATILPFAQPRDRIIVAQEARRQELFFAVFQVSGDPLHPLLRVRHEQVVSTAEVTEHLPETDNHTTCWLIGSGIHYLPHKTLAQQYTCLHSVSAEQWQPSARGVVHMGFVRFQAGEIDDLDTFEPLYLRPFQTQKARSIFDRLPKSPPKPSAE